MIKKNKIFFSFFLLQFAVASWSFAQITSLAPSLIGSTGNFSSAGGISISSSVGEPIVTTVSSGTLTLTQGFQQAFLACPTITGITASPNTIICPGNNVSLSPVMTGGTPPLTYFWSSGETTSSIVATPSLTTVYTFSVVGCPGSATHTVTVHPVVPIPTITATPNPVCVGGTLSLAANSAGSSTYQWTDPGGSGFAGQTLNISNITTGAGGTYSVVGTNSTTGCSSGTGTVSVTVNPIPTLSMTATNPLCFGACNGTATATVITGTGPFTFLWSGGGGTNSTASALCPNIYSVTVTAGGCVGAGTVAVVAPPALTANIASTQPLCGCNGSGSASGSGGVAPYTYFWSGPAGTANTPNITGLCGGTHSITITDLNGCNFSSSVNLAASPGVTVTATFPATICPSGSTNIGVNAVTGTGSLSYAWSPAVTGSSAIVLASPPITTTYTVIISNLLSGCSDTAFVPLTVSPNPTVTVSGSTTVCSGQSATFGASGGVTYIWMPGTQSGATITTAALTAPATFTVTGTNAAGCSDTATIFVNVTATPVAAISASPATVCAGGISTLTASGNGTYLWSPSGSSSSSIVTPPLSSPANYTLTVSNGSCSDTATTLINVNSFSASITVTNNDSIICLGDIATLNASAGISYLWNTSPPQTSQNISVNPTISTMYVVTITGSGGCMGSDSVYIQVVPTPTPTISSSATTVCAGDAVTLTAGGGTTYSWTSGPATATYIVNPVSPTNNYQVTVFTGGCSAMTSVNIFTNPLPNISATANSNAICLGDSAILTASGNATNFNWAQGGPNPNVVFPTGTSTYTVIGTDANSCSNIATVSVTLNTIYVDAGPDITICPGYTADLNAIVTGSISTVTYLWSPDTLLNNPAVQNPSASPVDSVTQFVVQVSNGNCSAKDSVLVYSIRTPDCIIHVYNGITPNSDHDNATWIIDGISSFPDNKVLIFNRWGTKIWGANGYNNKDVVWKGTDEHNRALPDGTYYYMIELYDGQGGTIYSESKWVEVTH